MRKKKIEIIMAIMMLGFAFLFLPISESYLLSLFRTFAFQAFLLMSIVSVFFLFRKQWIPLAGGIASSMILLIILPPVFSSKPSEIRDADLRIAHFNVLKYNKDHENVLKAARDTSAEFLSFQEINQEWAEALKADLSRQYPYSIIEARNEDCNGIAVFSRLPIIDGQVVQYGETPNISGKLELKNGTLLNFITSHPKNPVLRHNHTIRNKHIRELARHISSQEGPWLALGDYNAVPWDTVLVNFKKKTRLKDSRKSLQPTYPSWFPLVQFPIDHMFHSAELECVSFQTISNSSDHLGILGHYRVKRAT